MPLKSRVCASQCSLVLLLLIAAAFTAGPAFGQLTAIRLTAPVSQSVTCPAGAPGGSGAGSTCVNLTHGTTVQFTVNYSGTAPFDPTVTWSFGSGGSNTIGTISSTGLYTAPASIFQMDTIVIKATSSSTGLSATATVYLIPTVAIAISPNTISLTDGQTVTFQTTVTGTSNTAVTFSIPDGTPGTLQTVNLTTVQYTAPVPITQKLTFNVTAKSVADPNQTAAAAITIIPAVLAGVTVNPPAVTIRSGGDTQNFTAIVVGLPANTVTWSISPNIGQITSTGTYIAPGVITSNQTVTVTATSTVNSTFAGSATITLTPPAITVTPANTTIGTNQTQQFVAMVNGAPFNNVTWSLGSPFGTISSTGLYTAPSFAPVKLTVQVIATSASDPTYFGTTNVSVGQSAATVSPSSVSLTNGQVQQFTFNIDGVPDPNPAQDVMWSLSSSIGKIAADGTYTAPAAVSSGQSVTLTGTYLIDPTKTAKATINLTVFVDVGHGSPNSTIQEMFVTNFYRNGFSNLVSLPPLGDVKKLGTTGYVQEFQDANKTSGVKLALVKPNASTVAPTNGTPAIFQLMGDIYGYYNSVGVTTAGYPTEDTQICPFFDPNNSCTYDIFDKGVALFVYKVPVFASQTQFTISGVIYTKWAALGGMSGGPGRPTDAQVAVTSSTKVTANVQTFAGGGIYQITSGANNNQVFSVLGSINDLYQNQGGPTGYLGLPTGNEIVMTNGDHRQTFEGGALQYTPGQTPVVRLPVTSVTLSSSGTLKMNAGDTTTVSGSPLTAGGAALTDRTLTWSTSNGQVVTIAQTTPGGATATLKAVGAGTASVRASADGIVSLPLTVTVTSQCCQVGEGAPTTVISQAFQNAVTRNRLNILLPAGSGVQRQGHGYVQQLQDATPGANITYLVTKSDNAANAYVVTGAILAAYQKLGGVTGSLGYPISDVSASGTQTFENGAALSGSPVTLVSGGIYTKWTSMGSDGGAAGPPTSAATPFSTIGANSGNAQAFKNGVIYAATAGPRAGQAYFVSGLILARYTAIGGVTGSFGMAVSDEFASGTTHRQNFEGGYIDYNTGDSTAQAHASQQKPAVTAPQSVLAGSRLHLAISGFQAGATVQVSITGQPDFTVTTANGAYAWDVYIPLTAKASSNTIHAADQNSGDTADAAYNVLSLSNNRATFAKTQGDVQTGMPGALLPQMLQVTLKDASGNPVIGAPLVFQSTPGATMVQTSTATDQNGMGQTGLRLPASQGLAAVTVDSPGIASAPVTFFVTASASSLASFPKQTETATTPLGNGTATIAQKGALLTAAASIVRYYQNRGDLQAPNGLADPTTLNAFLKSFCATDAGGKQICDGFLTNPDSIEQVVNLWRVGEFVNGALDVSTEQPDANTVRDLLAAGSPVLLELALSADGNPAGGHSVVAIGVGDSGQILIQDPSPAFAQTSLDGYGAGFVVNGHTFTGQLQSAVRLLPRAPSPTRFLLTAISQPSDLMQNLTLEARSIAGLCGRSIDITDSADATGTALPAAIRLSRFAACDGSQQLYQINAGASAPYRATLTDLAKGGSTTDLSGSAPGSFKASRPVQALAVAPQDLTIVSNGVVNGASFTVGIAPGGLFTIFGSGLAGAGVNTSVTIKGEATQVTMSNPFQVNGVVPGDITPGTYDLQIQSPFGLVTQSVDIAANAPAIFISGDSTHGTITNQDGSTNSDLAPAVRGQTVTIYATGLGTVTQQGNSQVVVTPVSAVLAGVELPTSFAGLAPGLTGIYQVNLLVPSGTPPGLDLPLLLRQGGVDGNTVSFSVQ